MRREITQNLQFLQKKTGELIHEITTNIKQEEKEKDISFYSCKNNNKDT